MDYLVMKLRDGGEPESAADWQAQNLVRGIKQGETEEAAKAGYTGPGVYRALPWSGEPVNLVPGAPEISDVPIPSASAPVPPLPAPDQG